MTTLAEFVLVLADPVGYVTGMLSNFVTYGYDEGNSTIWIGVTGSGIAPNYKIEEPSRPVVINVRGNEMTMTATPGRTFSGRNHREMTELNDLERHDDHWGAHTMTFAELKILLSQLSQSKSAH